MTSRPYPDPASRFKILPQPLLSPAQCLICGSPSRACVDTGVELNVNGLAFRVYFCVLCFQDANTQVEGYLESIGEDTGGSASPAKIQKYLSENNLKVISSEHLDSLTFWATGSSAAVDAVLADPLNAEAAEAEPGNDSEDESDVQPDVDEPERNVLPVDDGIPTLAL